MRKWIGDNAETSQMLELSDKDFFIFLALEFELRASRLLVTPPGPDKSFLSYKNLP
jgi:hypothetical protein